MALPHTKIQIGLGTYMLSERHANTEMPACYPDTIINMGGFLGLTDLHSAKHYHPTPEARKILAEKIQASKGWCYLERDRSNRQRSE